MTTLTALTDRAVAWPQDESKWHARRSIGVGASEVAAVVGVSPWDTPLGVYQRKIGESSGIEDNRAMKVGRALEKVVVDEFCEEKGETVELYPCPMIAHPEYPFMLATPDADLASGSLLEAKTANTRMLSHWGPSDTDEIPENYLIQCQWQLHVADRETARLAVLIGGDELRTYTVERNDRLIAMLAESVIEFWGRVEDRRPPAPDYSHPSTPELIKGIYRTVTDGDVIPLSEEIRQAWLKYEEIGREVKSLESEREALRSQVAVSIGEHLGGDLGDGRFIKRTEVKRDGYYVKPSNYVTMRACKVKKGKK